MVPKKATKVYYIICRIASCVEYFFLSSTFIAFWGYKCVKNDEDTQWLLVGMKQTDEQAYSNALSLLYKDCN